MMNANFGTILKLADIGFKMIVLKKIPHRRLFEVTADDRKIKRPGEKPDISLFKYTV